MLGHVSFHWLPGLRGLSLESWVVQSYVVWLSRSVTRKSFDNLGGIYTMFISNNQGSFHLW